MADLILQEHTGKVVSPFAAVSQETKEFIFSAVPANIRRAYKQAVDKFAAWLDGRKPNDRLLAEYMKHLHDEGKAPSMVVLMPAPFLCVITRQARVFETQTATSWECLRLMDSFHWRGSQGFHPAVDIVLPGIAVGSLRCRT